MAKGNVASKERRYRGFRVQHGHLLSKAGGILRPRDCCAARERRTNRRKLCSPGNSRGKLALVRLRDVDERVDGSCLKRDAVLGISKKRIDF